MGPTRGQTGKGSLWVRRKGGLRRLARSFTFTALFAPIPSPLSAAETPIPSPDLIAWVIVLAACALAVAGGLWGVSEHMTARRLRRSMRTVTAKAHAMLSARDAWLAGGRESLMVWGANINAPISFGDGAALLEACLTGADAAMLSEALDKLAAEGAAFDTLARAADGRRISVRGRPSGGAAVVYLEPLQRDGLGNLDFRAALDALPIPVWLRRPSDLSLSFVNRAFLAQSGAASEEAALSGNVALDRSERDLAAAAIGDGETVQAKRFAILSGRRRALQFTLSPLEDGGVAGAALDVTALADAEAKLKQHVDVHAEMLDKLAAAVAIFNPDKKLTFHNRAYARLFGLDEAFLNSRPGMGEILDRLREARRPPEQSNFRAWRQEQLKKFESTGEIAEELWHLPGGTALRAVTQPHPLGGMIFLYEDFSSQLRLESSYNTLIKVQKATLDTLQEGIAVFGPDGRLKLSNAAFALLWRLEEAELSGEPHLKRVAAACAARFGRDRAWEIVTATVTAAAPERQREWGEVERSDGAVISLSIAPLPDGATLASFVDATDRFRIESALRERNEALEAADKLKTEFVRRVSYELRTPLNSIIGFAELLKAGTPGALNRKQAEYIEDIVTSSNGLRALINNVLDLSEFETGARMLDLERIDLFVLLESIAAPVREWTGRLGLTFELDCKQDAGTFTGDTRRLKQIVFNLLSNAIKYTPRGGTVTLGGDIAGDRVRIFVKDTGPGVASDVMPSAFERFSAKGVAAVRAGAGLGLALVNRFVDLHKGWVELESVPGKGTKVTCHLPREAVAATPEPVAVKVSA
jgi:signal transduction histidine kinase